MSVSRIVSLFGTENLHFGCKFTRAPSHSSEDLAKTVSLSKDTIKIHDVYLTKAKITKFLTVKKTMVHTKILHKELTFTTTTKICKIELKYFTVSYINLCFLYQVFEVCIKMFSLIYDEITKQKQ